MKTGWQKVTVYDDEDVKMMITITGSTSSLTVRREAGKTAQVKRTGNLTVNTTASMAVVL